MPFSPGWINIHRIQTRIFDKNFLFDGKSVKKEKRTIYEKI